MKICRIRTINLPCNNKINQKVVEIYLNHNKMIIQKMTSMISLLNLQQTKTFSNKLMIRYHQRQMMIKIITKEMNKEMKMMTKTQVIHN